CGMRRAGGEDERPVGDDRNPSAVLLGLVPPLENLDLAVDHDRLGTRIVVRPRLAVAAQEDARSELDVDLAADPVLEVVRVCGGDAVADIPMAGHLELEP